MPTKKIFSSAPTRIDLAGGTLDIWPLFLFLKNPCTINLAINLKAETTLEVTEPESSSGTFELRSQDQNTWVSLPWSELESDSIPKSISPGLQLHFRLLKFFAQEKRNQGHQLENTNLKISTVAKSPAGAGLGGSSTLSVSLIGALSAWSRSHVDLLKDGESLTKITRDTETTVIDVPAGMQDYYGAMFGSLQSIRWLPGRIERSWFKPSLAQALQERLILFYSGQSRNSGINNWTLFKSFIDRQNQIRERFQKIADSTHDLGLALENEDWEKVGDAIRGEWEVRRTLAHEISTPTMNQAFETAFQQGATAGKVCGAGGGGCFFVYIPSPSASIRKKIIEQVSALGITHLPFEISLQGLEVRN